MPRGVKRAAPKKQRGKRASTKPQGAHQAPAAFASADLPLGRADVASLSGAELRAYARRAGVPQRDCDNLSEDRLRVNTKLAIANTFELIEEGL